MGVCCVFSYLITERTNINHQNSTLVTVVDTFDKKYFHFRKEKIVQQGYYVHIYILSI